METRRPELSEIPTREQAALDGGCILCDAWEGAKYIVQKTIIEPAQEIVRAAQGGAQ